MSAASVDLLTTADVCRLLQYSKQTITRMVRAGELVPFGVRPRGHRRFLRSDVERLVKARKAEAAAPVLPMKQPRGRRP